MPLTITVQNRGVAGNLKYVVATVAFDNSYLSGGESLTAANLNLDSISVLLADAPAGYKLAYDYTNSLLRAYRIGVITGAEVSGANNTLVKNAAGTGIEVAGTGTAYQVALAEVTATSDMSTDLASVRIMAFGG